MSEIVFVIYGLISGLLLAKLMELNKSKKICFSWYHWALSSGLFVSLFFLIAFILTSFDEGEPQAAGMAILIFGGALLVAALVIYRLLFAKQIFVTNND